MSAYNGAFVEQPKTSPSALLASFRISPPAIPLYETLMAGDEIVTLVSGDLVTQQYGSVPLSLGLV